MKKSATLEPVAKNILMFCCRYYCLWESHDCIQLTHGPILKGTEHNFART